MREIRAESNGILVYFGSRSGIAKSESADIGAVRV